MIIFFVEEKNNNYYIFINFVNFFYLVNVQLNFPINQFVAYKFSFFYFFFKGFEILIVKPGEEIKSNKIIIPFNPSKIKFKYSKKG